MTTKEPLWRLISLGWLFCFVSLYKEEKIKKCCCTNVAQQQIRAKKDLERSLIYQGFWLLGTSNFTRL